MRVYQFYLLMNIIFLIKIQEEKDTVLRPSLRKDKQDTSPYPLFITIEFQFINIIMFEVDFHCILFF